MHSKRRWERRPKGVRRGGSFIGILIVGFSLEANAALQETLPPWHWAHPVIEALQLRGVLPGLDPLRLPYTRGEVAKALIGLRRSLEEGGVDLSLSERKQITRLVSEFRAEIQALGGQEGGGETLLLGLRFQEDVGKMASTVRAKGVHRLQIGADWGGSFFVASTMTLDQYRVDDPSYIGKKWRGIVGYTEQSYVRYEKGRIRLEAGRDFLRWGYGRSGTLLFCDVCRPLDRFSGTFVLGPFHFTFLTAVLDRMTVSDSLYSGTASRYLSAHRADLSLFGGRLRLGVSEAILYGGIGRPLDWVYVNPFMIYHGEQMNQKDQANTLGTIDLLWHPVPQVRLYGSFLIDDIQVEKTGLGDLEPNELGWIVGSEWADPFRIDGLTLFGEFARVTNRTYKTPTPWERFLFRNEPIGHPLGHDFDTWKIGGERWFGASLCLGVAWIQTRKGEGSLFTPWDAPWMSRTVEEGYSEPYLTGVVERHRGVLLSMRVYPTPRWGFEGRVKTGRIHNVGHTTGMDRTETSWRVGVWFSGEVGLRM